MVEGARPKSVLSGGEKYRAILIGCKCGIAPNVAIICYYNKIYIFEFLITQKVNSISNHY